MFDKLQQHSDLEYLNMILPMYVKISKIRSNDTNTKYIGKIQYSTTEDDWDDVYNKIKRHFQNRLMEFYTIEQGRCFELYLRHF